MKITRVLLAASYNPLYYQFWNPLSQVYLEKFNIKPTLIWLGKPEEIDLLELSSEWGNIIVQEPHPEHHVGWQSAWAIFWFMRFYPNDIFCTMGIDQVPLSRMLFGEIPEPINEETYLMLVDDGYLPSHWEDEGGTSPTSFHIVKGSIANKVYAFESSFHDEIDKIAQSGVTPYYGFGDMKWGLDESYSSNKLRQYRDAGGKVESKRMFKTICERRIECCREHEIAYDENRLKEGWYGDAHLCRPYSDHKNYIDKILNLIPKP